MSYMLKSFANDVCNLQLNQKIKDDEELNKVLSIYQKATFLLTGNECEWSKSEIAKNVDVYTLPIDKGRMYIFYAVKEN